MEKVTQPDDFLLLMNYDGSILACFAISGGFCTNDENPRRENMFPKALLMPKLLPNINMEMLREYDFRDTPNPGKPISANFCPKYDKMHGYLSHS
jgi:hypothetical protein